MDPKASKKLLAMAERRARNANSEFACLVYKSKELKEIDLNLYIEIQSISSALDNLVYYLTELQKEDGEKG